MTFKRESHALLWLYSLLSFSIILVNCQETDSCTDKYLAANTYKSLASVDITCYAPEGEECEVFYSPVGTGCIDDSLTSVGKVASNTTSSIDFNLPYGGALCSDYQISAQSADDTSTRIVRAVLPRAPQAGTKFHTVFDYLNGNGDYVCSIYALAQPANVTYTTETGADDVNSVVTKYGIMNMALEIRENSGKILRINSDNPIIVSCRDTSSSEQFITLEPIHSSPIVGFSDPNGYISIAAVDCDTNTLQTSSDMVTLTSSESNGDPCVITAIEMGRSYQVNRGCIVLVTPVADSNTCVSAILLKQNRGLLGTGLPEEKLSTRIVTGPYRSFMFLVSFEEGSCQRKVGDEIIETKYEWNSGTLEDKIANAYITSIFADSDWLQCSTPVYIGLFSQSIIQYRGGAQPMETWVTFFESVECTTPSPPLAPPPAPSLAKKPSFSMYSASLLLAVFYYFKVGN